MERQQYTKNDLVEFVSREELIALGVQYVFYKKFFVKYVLQKRYLSNNKLIIKQILKILIFRGGIACKIWREVLRCRLEASQKVRFFKPFSFKNFSSSA